jgi:hypothetical protein
MSTKQANSHNRFKIMYLRHVGVSFLLSIFMNFNDPCEIIIKEINESLSIILHVAFGDDSSGSEPIVLELALVLKR